MSTSKLLGFTFILHCVLNPPQLPCHHRGWFPVPSPALRLFAARVILLRGHFMSSASPLSEQSLQTLMLSGGLLPISLLIPRPPFRCSRFSGLVGSLLFSLSGICLPDNYTVRSLAEVSTVLTHTDTLPVSSPDSSPSVSYLVRYIAFVCLLSVSPTRM